MLSILIGMILDYIIGDPHSFPHPVVGIGKGITFLENRLYQFKNKKAAGGLLVILVLVCLGGFVIGLRTLGGFNTTVLLIIDSYLCFAGIAYRSLLNASLEVRRALEKEGVKAAREKVAMYVSRDTNSLTRKQILKTVLETLSENSVDGILAPLFYLILGQVFFGQGILFLWLYKAINTMDSMIAYKNERYMEFGYVAAKLDDLANFIPARLSVAHLLLAGGFTGLNIRNGLKIVKRDHGNSASPNAGYPESVIAGMLNVQIGGTYKYFGKKVNKKTIGDDVEFLEMKHLIKAEGLVTAAYMLIIVFIIFFTFIGSFIWGL